jgi:hypothetical protein
MKYLLVFLLLIGQVRAEESVVYLNKGQPAPFDGFAVSFEKAKAIRLLDLNYQFEQKKTAALTEENTIVMQRLTNAQDQNKALATQLVEQRDSSFFSKVGMFILGAGVASVVAYGATRAVR